MGKYNGNSVKLFLKERAQADAYYKEVVCSTELTFGVSNNTIEANSKCGPDKLPGQQDWTLSGGGYALEDAAGTGTVSFRELRDWAANKTELSYYIADSYTSPTIVGEECDCTLGSLEWTGNADEAASFTFEILVSGTPVNNL
jgi:hypothetical protein